MDQVNLGRSGTRVSSIGTGTWQAGDDTWGPDVNDRDCIDAIVRASELGMGLVDTAENYGRGHSEEVLGRAIKKAGRRNVFVATKVSEHHLRPADVEKACNASLKRLGITHIDLYQVHWTDPYDQVPLQETMKAMERLEKRGVVSHIGVSNFAVRDLEEARSALSRTDIVSNQVQYNLLHRNVEAQVVPYCRRERISILAFSPLARGALTGKYRSSKRPSDAVRTRDVFFRSENLRLMTPLLTGLKRIAKAHGKTSAQVALAWLRSQPGIIPIPGTKRPEQTEENAGAAGWDLTSTEWRELDRLSQSLRLNTF
ncbi:MAG: aldo/keto reductase [Methanobacteriota archaeon]|nr:MAG: aldo/keto reductase [Euryarchaeota archaeon]